MADGNYVGTSAQDAVDTATDWVWLPPGYFDLPATDAGYSALEVTTDNLTVMGSGAATTLDGGGDKCIIMDAKNLTVANLRAVNDNTADQAAIGRGSNAQNNLITNCYLNAGGIGIKGGQNARIIGNIVESSGTAGGFGPALVNGETVVGNAVKQTDHNGFYTAGDDCLIAFNSFENCGKSGVAINAPNGEAADNVVMGNRIHNTTSDGCFIGGSSVDTIVANNRISGAGGMAIDDSGTNTVTDANSTGAAN